MVLQLINIIFRKKIDNKTKYNDSISSESEKIRFIYTYFGFPITILFKRYFKQIRKDSYYVRRLKELENIMQVYQKNDIPINEEIKNDWVTCNRYLKLKKLKEKQEA